MKNPPMKRNKFETHIHREVKGIARKKKKMHVHVCPSVELYGISNFSYHM
jgi:hypothetical protein